MSPRFTSGIPETAETALPIGSEYCYLENISRNFSAGCGKHFEYPRLKGVVMETFGSGNAPGYDWLLEMLKEAVERGIVIVNVTQCLAGSVEMHRYKPGENCCRPVW